MPSTSEDSPNPPDERTIKSGDIVQLRGTVIVDSIPYSDKILVSLGPNEFIVVPASECKPVSE